MEIEADKIHPYKRWVMVKADPRVKKTSGGIVLTDELVGVERVMEGTGTVLAVGSEVEAADVVCGVRVAYRGFLKDVSQGMIQRKDGCDVFLIRIEDLLAVIDDSVTMGAFSGPQSSD